MDMGTGEKLWHRRHAMQIAMQLPESQQDALLVLEATRKLVQGYLTEDQVGEVLPLPLPEREAVVLAFSSLSPSNR